MIRYTSHSSVLLPLPLSILTQLYKTHPLCQVVAPAWTHTGAGTHAGVFLHVGLTVPPEGSLASPSMAACPTLNSEGSMQLTNLSQPHGGRGVLVLARPHGQDHLRVQTVTHNFQATVTAPPARNWLVDLTGWVSWPQLFLGLSAAPCSPSPRV